MARVIDSKLREQIAARLQYYREMGIYDFYRREGGLVQGERLGRLEEPERVFDVPDEIGGPTRISGKADE